jgi:hypothetical protein
MADDPDLNRRVAEFLLRQNEVAGRFATPYSPNTRATNAVAHEFAEQSAANQGTTDDIAKYAASAGIEPASPSRLPSPQAMIVTSGSAMSRDHAEHFRAGRLG